MRMTAVKASDGRGDVHLGVDLGASATVPLCPADGAGMRTTSIHAATCRACIVAALARGLPIDGLVVIPESIRRQVAFLRSSAPDALAGVSDTDLMVRLMSAA